MIILCLNLNKYEELEIDGGVHAYFGYYSKQKHDGNALISRDEQQQETVTAMKSFVNKNIIGNFLWQL